MSEQMWIERAQTAEAQLASLKNSFEPALERVQMFKKNFGVRERSNGEIDIDFDILVDRIGPEGALELRAIIDEKYLISGAPGEKPRLRVVNDRSTG